jgi:predicted RNase H-like nuclease (RuvC/YqgF family)
MSIATPTSVDTVIEQLQSLIKHHEDELTKLRSALDILSNLYTSEATKTSALEDEVVNEVEAPLASTKSEENGAAKESAKAKSIQSGSQSKFEFKPSERLKAPYQGMTLDKTIQTILLEAGSGLSVSEIAQTAFTLRGNLAKEAGAASVARRLKVAVNRGDVTKEGEGEQVVYRWSAPNP